MELNWFYDINWDENLIKSFVKYGKLNHKDEQVLMMRYQKETIKEIAKMLDVSTRTINRDLEEYRKIYDKLSANHSEMFPPRVLKINVYAELSEYEGTLKFKINDEDDIYEIDMNEKHFISSKEMFNYIYNQVCTITGKDLSDLNSVQFINNLSWKVNFK